MKRKYLFFNLLVFVFLIACSPNNSVNNNIENINFTVDKTHLSQSYQLKDPYAEFVSKNGELNPNNEVKVLISLGIMESSGLDIKEITLSGSKISIYADSIYDDDNLKIAVPQAMVSINQAFFQNPLDNYSFEIINDNGNPIDITLNINDAISKVDSHFKIASNISPDINLVKKEDYFVWDIDYVAAFDKTEANLPLVKFHATVDANNGNILDSKKTLIANPIDNGSILTIESDKYILYKKSIESIKTDSNKEELWIYNINTDKSELVFASDYIINSTQFSPDLSAISLIETNGDIANLYIIPKKTNKAYKVALKEGFTPSLAIWEANDNLVLLEKLPGETNICKYNIKKDEQDEILNINKPINNISYENGLFLFTEKIDKGLNEQIYLTTDFKYLEPLFSGFSPEFIKDNIIIYLKSIDTRDTNELIAYDINKKENIFNIEGKIEKFQISSNNYISFIEKKENHNFFIMYGINIDKLKLNDDGNLYREILSNSISDRFFYNKDYNLFFLNVSIPFEYEYKNLIYLIDLIEDK